MLARRSGGPDEKEWDMKGFPPSLFPEKPAFLGEKEKLTMFFSSLGSLGTMEGGKVAIAAIGPISSPGTNTSRRAGFVFHLDE